MDVLSLIRRRFGEGVDGGCCLEDPDSDRLCFCFGVLFLVLVMVVVLIILFFVVRKVLAIQYCFFPCEIGKILKYNLGQGKRERGNGIGMRN